MAPVNSKNIIFDLGGVLMMHNMPGCIAAFRDLMGEDGMTRGLGLLLNGEGVEDSLMDRFECGLVSEEEFVDTILRYSHPGTTREQVTGAWITMHAGIPADLLNRARQYGKEGNHLFVLSNNNVIHTRDIMAHYDMSCFEHMFFSHLLHARKPDNRIFESVVAYLKERGLDKLETWFIDDIAANREAGQRFGWHTASSLDDLEKQLK